MSNIIEVSVYFGGIPTAVSHIGEIWKKSLLNVLLEIRGE